MTEDPAPVPADTPDTTTADAATSDAAKAEAPAAEPAAKPAEPADPAVLVTRDETDEAVAVLTLNRPARYNALTKELKEALLEAVGKVAAADDVRALVITGAGKAFCVGQDLGEHAAALEADPATAFDTVTEHYNPIVLELADLPFPVVAAINGACVGAGLGFALACDLRIAAEGQKFSTAFTGIGLTADSGLSASLAHAVGVARATELLLLNEQFTAEDAVAWGLLHKAVAPDDVLSTSLELARRLAAGPTKAYVEIKRAVRRGAVSALPDVLAAEGAAQARLAATADHQAAVKDFLAKRTPTFQGR
ncbi:enoyl-CoA hydratase/isomerase family protein [Pseudonocardia sp. TRM90224]|uniref:enoyl-CoA hydratase/isomerase family protein n=1 Tax=Pseudonocardia sp. TRM90224 TaxID=2812678 RepID=UPI001E2F44D1|nr:enoyl-CoA hydratase-related protein [Pseudonocardia sp. TRM90224]